LTNQKKNDNLNKKRLENFMETRVALIGIIVENKNSIEQLNKILHEYGNFIISRMGLPYKEKNINIISIAIDAPTDVINAMTGKIGRLDGISTKTAFSNV
jgi:putative iron-only hydrogenase system regulator